MVSQKTKLGEVRVDRAVYTLIAGYAATKCFGVKGMAVRSVTDGLVHLLRREAMSKGVNVTFLDDDSIEIDLHIIIDRGINIGAIGEAIIGEVRYNVSRLTGTDVKAVNVFVDSVHAG